MGKTIFKIFFFIDHLWDQKVPSL